MENQDKTYLKSELKNFWNKQACGTATIDSEKYSLQYFEEIEQHRYDLQPEIFNFAQFTRFHGKRILEVGVGAGTDFLQWVRAGAECYGIDLTPEAIDHVSRRLQLYGLEAKDLLVADAEDLPFVDNYFDAVYSWGVIHHSPNTIKALEEIIRVIKPGGEAKIMIYHRHSLLAFFFWIKHALLKFRPWKSIAWVLWNHMESIGTKGYTIKEFNEILSKYNNLSEYKVGTIYTYYDKLARFPKFMQWIAKVITAFTGREKIGWFLTIEFKKK
jgi:ubiquinone/menaquinone biosynthesis C-methylase UbiE